MLWALVKKDIQHLLREKSVLILLFVMPLGLIAILGYAQSGGGIEPFSIAVVDTELTDEETQRFVEEMEAEGIPEFAIQQLMASFNVKDILVEDVFRENLEEITIETSLTLDEALADKELAAVIEFPEGYQQSIWRTQILSRGEQEEVIVHMNREQSTNSQLINSVVQSFYETLRMNQMAYEIGDETILQQQEIQRTIEQTQNRTIRVFDYVVVAMAAMFVLYTAGLVSRFATDEKRTKVVDRMILSQAPTYIYGISKWVTGTLTAGFQLCAIFSISYLAFGVKWGSLLQFGLTTLAISMTVGGLTVLLTAMNFKFDSYKASTLFTNLIVTIFAFIGGSFIQIDILNPIIGKVGELTPNGTTMTAYFHAFQGGDFQNILPSILLLVGYSVVLVVLAVCLFPKRGGQR
ncbi:ABC transporter permease [Alkalicoccobacillus gibsonii]|uniref:ABC transporter permease n=1 Tax=Alkalicoccobacillus gibsonii TaxID=79881 RepID=A0ABU9VFS9_9BACI